MNIRPVGAELFHVDGQTDRYDEAKCSFFAILGTRLKTTIITHALYECLTRYFALTEERKTRTFENMALRRTSGSE